MIGKGMEFIPEHIEYRVKQTGSSYLLWLKTLNRYLHLEEPAYQIFRQLAEGISRQEIIKECKDTYLLPADEAKRFVGEIIQQFQSLYRNHQKTENRSLAFEKLSHPFKLFREKQIKLWGKTIRFGFGDRSMAEFIFPHFYHLEMPTDVESCDLHLEIYGSKGKVYLIRNRDKVFVWPADQASRLKGTLFLEIINLVHHRTEESWMGIIHAAALGKESSSIMFPAQPGGGKSTLAALLMAHGFDLLSDDFTPLAMNSQHVYSFPGAVSLKQGSLDLLESYFPGLEDFPKTTSLGKGINQTFLPPVEPSAHMPGAYPVSAIVFVQYDKQADCELVRRDKLEAINDFLRESWLADNARAAEQFMDWYMSTPCYSLRYGNHHKAINSVQTLFKDVT